MTEHNLSYILPLAPIDTEAQVVKIHAAPDELTELARRYDIPSIEVLNGALTVRRVPQGYHVQGSMRADLHYACRVTREPFPASLHEPIDVIFTEDPLPDPTSEEFLADPQERLPLEGDSIPLGALVAETLALALDPFPRGPDADAAMKALGIMTEEEAKAASNPFAVLKNPGSSAN